MEIKHVIVGCGLAGIVLAERIANELNEEVLIIEKRNHIGGNCYDSYDSNGILIHNYGPHIFHTNIELVKNYITKFSKFNMFQHKVLSYVDGNYIPMPITTNTINKIFNKNFDNEEAEQFINKLKCKLDVADNSEQQILKSVGYTLYEKLFKNYTTKQWGMLPSELSPEVIKRMPIRFNTDNRYFSDSFQGLPINGYTKMFEKMLDNKNIKILLNTDYKDIINDIKYEHLYYSGPIDYFYDYKFGELQYRSLNFEFEQYHKNKFQQAPVINYPNDYDFTRITEFKKLTLQDNQEYTTIVKEFPCDYKDNGERYYPIINKKNIELYDSYKKLNNSKNIHFIGRLGLYKYFNMDMIIMQSLNLFDEIKNGN